MSSPIGFQRISIFVSQKFAKSSSLKVLRNRDFCIFVVGNLCALSGAWMQRMALAWLVWELTKSAFWLGVFSAADLFPSVIFTLLGGVAADRVSRYYLIISCYAASGLVAVILAVMQIFGTLEILSLLLLAVLQGTAQSFGHPARLAILRSLVPKNEAGDAIAVGAVMINLARMTGPAIGGIIIAAVGIAWVFILNAVIMAVFVLVLTRLEKPAVSVSAEQTSVLRQIGGGISLVMSNVATRITLIFIFLGGMFLRSIWDLVPAFADRSFEDSVFGVAVLSSVMAMGAVFGGFMSNADIPDQNLLSRILLAWIFGGVAVCGLAVSDTSLAAICFMTLLGFFGVRGMVLTQTYMQTVIPDNMQGRALSIFALLARCSPLFGALLVGGLADLWGLLIPTLMNGVVITVLAGIVWLVMAHRQGTTGAP